MYASIVGNDWQAGKATVLSRKLRPLIFSTGLLVDAFEKKIPALRRMRQDIIIGGEMFVVQLGGRQVARNRSRWVDWGCEF